MQDITSEMLEFKDAIRHAWNTYFAEREPVMSIEMQKAFNQVEIGFFSAIVLAPLGVSHLATEYRKQPLPWLTIAPARDLKEWMIQFGDSDDRGNIRWSRPVLRPGDDGTEFLFFDFFDWAPFGFVDFPYVRLRVVSPESSEGPCHMFAIVEQQYCKFLFKGINSLD